MEIIKRIKKINEMISEISEDKQRYADKSEYCRKKSESDTYYNNYSSAGITIEQLEDELHALKSNLTESINKISSTTYRRLLKKRYIDNKQLKTIAKEMNYSYSYTRFMMNKADTELKNIIHDNTQ